MADMFTCFNGEEVDLDDLNTYRNSSFSKPVRVLYMWAWSLMGRSLYYMQFFHPEVDWDEQEEKVSEYCRQFAAECKDHFLDTPENKLWFKKFIFKFQDETENQC